jgi:hypothetical protein
MFQLPLSIPTSTMPAAGVSPEQIAKIGEEAIKKSGMAQFWWAVLIVGLLVVGFFILRTILRAVYGKISGFQKKVMLVTLPKEAQLKEKAAEVTVSKIHELIGVAETFYSALSGLKARGGLKDWFLGAGKEFAFDLIVHNGKIAFYIITPTEWQQFFEQQIHAQYPMAQVEEVVDYNIFSPQGVVRGATLRFARPYFFPIKTYKKSESDLLNALTQALSKIASGDGAGIQLILRPAPKGWGSYGLKVAKQLQEGKSLSDITGGVGFLKFLGGVLSFLQTKKTEEGSKEPAKPLSQTEQEMIKGIEEKASKAAFEANINIIASAPNQQTADVYLGNIINAFSQYNIYNFGNEFRKIYPNINKLVTRFVFRYFSDANKIILNTEELASIFHFPTPYIETPNILWLVARKAPAPLDMPEEGMVLGRNLYRGKETIVRMDKEARRRHLYAIGQTGTGKSTFFQELIKQDIKDGEGVCVIDPHGDLIEDVLSYVPENRVDDVIYYNPADFERPMGLNLLEYDPKFPEQKTFVINEMINIFDKLYDLRQTGGPMFEQYMRNAMLLVMEHPESGSTLMEIPKVLADEDFRRYKLSKCKNQVTRDFWIKEAEKAGGDAALSNMTPYITSKLNPFISSDIMRPIISQQKTAFNLREIMDNRKILLLNLSKGLIGDYNAYLLGMVLVGKIWAAALSRADMPMEQRQDFYLYIDEFQNFTTDTIISILSEARKYRLSLNITHQFIAQLVRPNDTKIRDAVFGNVGTQICFRIGPEDAEFMEKQYAPVFNAHDLINLSNFHAYVKLLIAGQTSRPFNMEIYRHWEPWSKKYEQALGLKKNLKVAEAIKEISRLKYGKDRNLVEQEILKRAEMIEEE